MTRKSLLTSQPEYTSVLRHDPELAGRISEEMRPRAEQASRTLIVRRDCGIWQAKDDADIARDGLGMLVMQGVLVRRVGSEDQYAAELLSEGDVVQPSQHDGEEAMLPFEATWKINSPLCLAVLDLEWMRRMAAFPEVFAELAGRIMLRQRRLASQLAIAQRHRLDDRLRLLFWDLADRYGRVGPHGVRLDVDLTHELLSHLVGAHRPSVSVALGRLERSGHITRENGHWVLKGHMPDFGEMLGTTRDGRS